MIKKLTKQMLLAQVLSVLTTSICMLVDSLVIGRCLGVGAVAAYGLSNPILLIIGGIGSILSAGVQASCSKSIGQGLLDEANKGYASAVGTALGVSTFFLLFVIVLQNYVPTWMGAGKTGELFESTKGYLIGFTIGAPACMIALVMIPFLQMAGQMALLISAVVAMTVTDIALDLVNAYFLHWGLFGMGLASALSYYVALLVAIWYFFSKKSIFKFKLRNVSLAKDPDEHQREPCRCRILCDHDYRKRKQLHLHRRLRGVSHPDRHPLSGGGQDRPEGPASDVHAKVPDNGPLRRSRPDCRRSVPGGPFPPGGRTGVNADGSHRTAYLCAWPYPVLHQQCLQGLPAGL